MNSMNGMGRELQGLGKGLFLQKFLV